MKSVYQHFILLSSVAVHKYSYRKSAVGTELVKYVILLARVS